MADLNSRPRPSTRWSSPTRLPVLLRW